MLYTEIMSDLKDILKGSLARLGVARQVEAAGVVEVATKKIAEFIDPNDFEVISFKDGTLKVAAKNSVVASEIQLKSNSIKIRGVHRFLIKQASLHKDQILPH